MNKADQLLPFVISPTLFLKSFLKTLNICSLTASSRPNILRYGVFRDQTLGLEVWDNQMENGLTPVNNQFLQASQGTRLTSTYFFSQMHLFKHQSI